MWAALSPAWRATAHVSAPECCHLLVNALAQLHCVLHASIVPCLCHRLPKLCTQSQRPLCLLHGWLNAVKHMLHSWVANWPALFGQHKCWIILVLGTSVTERHYGCKSSLWAPSLKGDTAMIFVFQNCCISIRQGRCRFYQAARVYFTVNKRSLLSKPLLDTFLSLRIYNFLTKQQVLPVSSCGFTKLNKWAKSTSCSLRPRIYKQKLHYTFYSFLSSMKFAHEGTKVRVDLGTVWFCCSPINYFGEGSMFCCKRHGTHHLRKNPRLSEASLSFWFEDQDSFLWNNKMSTANAARDVAPFRSLI